MKRLRWMDTFLALLSGLEYAYRTATDIEGPANEEEKKMIKNVNDNLKIIREVIFNHADDVKQQSEEVYEESELDKLHNDAERAYLKYGEAVKQSEIIREQENAAEKEARKSSTRRSKSALKAARSALRASLAAEIAEEEERERTADEFAKRARREGLMWLHWKV
ncbi:hypothetical protein PC110_g21538 [Phytophthora cactorum]|uniref:Uncharacterized protein n=1 Tax=Phytophthora cactorum TaxID=29920 RepID=A0A329RC44_9STRA|nr:hypothetical protein PC119_g17962 [Phytophthora cactorum]RAW22020.1 hypothetical protein PC110_g21538 [Phytophthora cactorum]